MIEQVEGFKNCKDQEPNEGCNIAMDAYFGLNSKLVKSCGWTNCWKPEGIFEPSDVVVVGNFVARVKDQNHVTNGVATSTSLVGWRVS